MTATSTWSVRLLLAAALLFGSQVALWTNPLRLETPLLALGALAWSALLLDLAARHRVRDIFGMFILAGLYGLYSSLLLSPVETLADVPRTLITRVMGGQVFAGVIGWLVFRALARGRLDVPFLLGCGALGVFWGMWARWSLVVFLIGDTEMPPLTLLMVALVGMGILAALWQFAHQQTAGAAQPPTAQAFLLTAREWVAVVVVTAALLALRLAQGLIDPISLTVIPSLIVFCWLMLWFQASPRGVTLLDSCLPIAAPRWIQFGIAAALFFAGGAGGYALPYTNTLSDPIALAGGFFQGFGLAWLPAVSLVLGGRALKRLARVGKL